MVILCACATVGLFLFLANRNLAELAQQLGHTYQSQHNIGLSEVITNYYSKNASWTMHKAQTNQITQITCRIRSKEHISKCSFLSGWKLWTGDFTLISISWGFNWTSLNFKLAPPRSIAIHSMFSTIPQHTSIAFYHLNTVQIEFVPSTWSHFCRPTNEDRASEW